MTDARALEDEGGEAEVEAADEGAVHPGEEQVAVVALHGGQREQAERCGGGGRGGTITTTRTRESISALAC